MAITMPVMESMDMAAMAIPYRPANLKASKILRQMARTGAAVACMLTPRPAMMFVPCPVVEACARALHDGETHYTDSRGLFDLRETIARECEARRGVAVDPDQVIVAGESGGGNLTLATGMKLLRDGDLKLIE